MGKNSNIPIFQMFPSLEKSLPRVSFLSNETPLFRSFSLERSLFKGIQNHPTIWIKDDGVSVDRIGGNKARKLEFLLGDAIAKECTSLVTFGRAGTNHGLTTLRAASKLGLKTKLIVSPQSIKTERSRKSVEKKLELFKSEGAELVMKPDILGLGLGMLMARSESINDHSYWIGPGGSEPLGNLGYVNAMLEFAEQFVDFYDLTKVDSIRTTRIFVPVGTAGTLAGLLVGSILVYEYLKKKMLDPIPVKFVFTGVLVVSPVLMNKKSVKNLAEKTARFLRTKLSAQDLTSFNKCFAKVGDKRTFEFEWDTSHFGPDYGESSQHVQDVIRQYDECLNVDSSDEMPIQLDHTYTGKAMAALFDKANSLHSVNFSSESPTPAFENFVFWNTYAREG